MRLSLLLMVLSLLAGCANTPSRHALRIDIDVPSAWSATADSAADRAPDIAAVSAVANDESWWQTLGDARLAELIDEGLRHNHSLVAAASRVEIATGQARSVGAVAQPQVGIAVDAGRSRRNYIGFPIPGTVGNGAVAASTTTVLGPILVASWEVDLWGRLRAGTGAALADVRAVEADLAGARLSMAAQIARAYFAAVEAQRQLELATAILISQQQSAAPITQRYDRGLRSSRELRLSRSSVATAKARQAVRVASLDGILRQLEVLLGRYPAATLEIGIDLPVASDAVPTGLPVDLLSRRPDLAAGERRVMAARLRLREAHRALLPRISLTASGGRSSEALADLLNGDFSVWNLVANLSQPLFQGGRLRAQIDMAAAGDEAALAAYVATALQAFAEVEGALVRIRALAQQETATAVVATQAMATEHLVAARYDRGLNDSAALLESQRRAYEAQSQLLTIRRQCLDARVDLHVALGGGFTSPSPITPPTN